MNPFWWNETSMVHNPQYYQPLFQPMNVPPTQPAIVAPTVHPTMENVYCHSDPQYKQLSAKSAPFYQSHHWQPVNQYQSHHCQPIVQQQPQYCQHYTQHMPQYCQPIAQQPQYCQNFAGKTSMHPIEAPLAERQNGQQCQPQNNRRRFNENRETNEMVGASLNGDQTNSVYDQHHQKKRRFQKQQKRRAFNGNHQTNRMENGASVNVSSNASPVVGKQHHQEDHPIQKQRYQSRRPNYRQTNGMVNVKVVPKNSELVVNEPPLQQEQKIEQKPKNRRQYNPKAEMKRLRNRRKLAVFTKPCKMLTKFFFQ